MWLSWSGRWLCGQVTQLCTCLCCITYQCKFLKVKVRTKRRQPQAATRLAGRFGGKVPPPASWTQGLAFLAELSSFSVFSPVPCERWRPLPGRAVLRAQGAGNRGVRPCTGQASCCPSDSACWASSQFLERELSVSPSHKCPRIDPGNLRIYHLVWQRGLCGCDKMKAEAKLRGWASRVA